MAKPILSIPLLLVCITVPTYIHLHGVEEGHLKRNGSHSWEHAVLPVSTLATSDANRLCDQNPYAKTLSAPLSEYEKQMDTWLLDKTAIERNLTSSTFGFDHDHKRFDAFRVMGEGCEQTCLGGECRSDESKISCGIQKGLAMTKESTSISTSMVSSSSSPCIVYSIGSNNEWGFEKDVLKKTPCEVHTFDCTGERDRFEPPDDPRLHFHFICLGTTNALKDTGEFWTLEQMQKRLNHLQIDLLKIDIEGYEWPLFNTWPNLRDINSPNTVLPMQILVEVHYQTQMKELAKETHIDFKFATDMINLHEHFLKMGYAVVVRDDNSECMHCTELTLIRIKCPRT